MPKSNRVHNDKSAAKRLVVSWINGNRNNVVDTLIESHAGLVATVLTHRLLNKGDKKDLTKRLVDRRIEIMKGT